MNGFQHPATLLGAGMMRFSDPRMEGLGGLGASLLNVGDIERQQQQLDIENQRARELADLQLRTMMAQAREAESKRLEAEREREEQEAFIAALPEDQQAAARANPAEFAKLYAQSLFAQPKTSTPQRIFQEMGAEQGTGKTFPQWYSEDYKTGVSVNLGGLKEPVRKRALTISSMQDSLSRYEDLLNEYGTAVIPGEEKARLRTAYTDVLLEAKELANLGVLSGPDLRLMQDKLSDPTSPTAAVRPASVFKAQVDEVRRKLDAARERLAETLPEDERTIVESQRRGRNRTRRQSESWQDAGDGFKVRYK